ncbi:hypothetical protein CTAYLR_010667 [Chrysophaeum taylorii]|uniref:NADP-dependent oxidoreductase domain-containing protein n=1 Tax=Chrysophaeum taylorii TaxID=2483200 RepID=A0AAD7U5Q7_9STRA|nr:hypothetical protein CTAYLR_010667 [Chrysophaeum taylorii]
MLGVMLLVAGGGTALQSVPRRDALTQLGGGAAAAAAPGLVSPPRANAATIGQQQQQQQELGKLGIGAWAWGDTLFWGYDSNNDNELRETFDFVANSKAGFIDTAEVYGFGRSETLVGDFSKAAGDFKVATKFAPLPWRTTSADVVKACEASLKRLDRDAIDLYQIHFPNAWSNRAYWSGLVECVEKNLVKAVGVSNYGVEATTAVRDVLAKRGIPLASNQIQYSLLYRYPEDNGLLATCRNLGVDVLAYSPLALGLLTNKFTRENAVLPAGPRKALVQTYLADDRFVSLQGVLDQIATAHASTPAAVSLNWTRAKGTIPIAGARNLRQAKANLAALDWDLDADEILLLDNAARNLPWLGIKPPFAEKDIFTGMKMFDS